jgi:acyl-CoA reductase-like NAD-dependent aldehyde dehydrogenase
MSWANPEEYDVVNGALLGIFCAQNAQDIDDARAAAAEADRDEMLDLLAISRRQLATARAHAAAKREADLFRAVALKTLGARA